ncbi:MAG: hypothetical protein AAGA96_04815 [Verrucomicrobiota bacterium]
MKSKAVPSFWDGFERLPKKVQDSARKQYELWLSDPFHPSVRFKRVGKFWSARVTGSYRALGVLDDDTVIWFFIGTHDEYERLLS